MEKVDLSVVVLNFNTSTLLSNCIDSLCKNTRDIRFEIIVVDNNSTEKGSLKLLEEFEEHPKITKIIRNTKNLGFANGNNLGIKSSKGRYILLLNSDTLIQSNVLGEMISWMDKNTNVGLSSCSLLNKDNTVQGSGGYFPTITRIFAWMLFIDDIPFVDRLIKPFHPVHGKSPFYKGTVQFNRYRKQDWITGAFFLMRSKVIKDVGVLDENYFMYVEDMDYCFRARKAGWDVVYNPKWSIVHLGGASSNKEFPILSEFKAMKQFYRKYYSDIEYLLLRVAFKIGSVLRMILFGILEGKEASKSYARAFKEI